MKGVGRAVSLPVKGSVTYSERFDNHYRPLRMQPKLVDLRDNNIKASLKLRPHLAFVIQPIVLSGAYVEDDKERHHDKAGEEYFPLTHDWREGVGIATNQQSTLLARVGPEPPQDVSKMNKA